MSLLSDDLNRVARTLLGIINHVAVTTLPFHSFVSSYPIANSLSPHAPKS